MSRARGGGLLRGNAVLPYNRNYFYSFVDRAGDYSFHSVHALCFIYTIAQAAGHPFGVSRFFVSHAKAHLLPRGGGCRLTER